MAERLRRGWNEKESIERGEDGRETERKDRKEGTCN